MSGPALHQPLDAAALLAAHDRRVALIRQAANEASEADYTARWHDVLSRSAAWFSSLPYSPLLYREPGGAFRCTVETAFYAMRLAGGQKFGTNLPSEKRRLIEPQYNHVVFLAAVCSGLDEPYRHFEVTRESDRAQWNPAGQGALATWLSGSPYSLQRRATPLPVERMRTALLAQSLIGQSLLTGYEAAVLSELFGAINPLAQPPANESLVHKVVRQAVAVAADFDRKAQQAVYEPVPYPVPAAIHVAAVLQPVVTPSPAPMTPASTPAFGQAPVSASPPAPGPATPAAPRREPAAKAVDESPGGTSPPPAAGQAATNTLQTGTTVSVAPANTPGPPASDAPDGTSKATTPTKHDPQLGLPFSCDAPPPVAIDPSAVRVPAARGDAATLPQTFDQVLEGQPNMIREFFRALREDVAAGKAKVEWTDKGLAIPKRLVGSFGVASDTLVEHLRRRGLLVSNVQAEIVLAVRAGELIMERSES